MESIIEKLIKGEMPSDEDIASELYEICDRVHASCDDDCPIYDKMTEEQKEALYMTGCKYHKAGHTMLRTLRGEEPLDHREPKR